MTFLCGKKRGGGRPPQNVTGPTDTHLLKKKGKSEQLMNCHHLVSSARETLSVRSFLQSFTIQNISMYVKSHHYPFLHW